MGDAHGGSWHRQVSLLSAEKIEAFRQKLWVDYGAFGENLVVEGFDLATLPVPSFFAIGDAVLEMTQIGKECHSDCAIRRQTGDCIMPREGVFARVVKGGTIRTGDEMKLLPTPADLPLRAAVITLSDKGSRGEREDKSGPLIVEMLTATGYKVEEALLLPDDAAQLKTQLLRLCGCPSGEPDPHHRRHRLCTPGYHPGGDFERSRTQRARHCRGHAVP